MKDVIIEETKNENDPTYKTLSIKHDGYELDINFFGDNGSLYIGVREEGKYDLVSFKFYSDKSRMKFYIDDNNEGSDELLRTAKQWNDLSQLSIAFDIIKKNLK